MPWNVYIVDSAEVPHGSDFDIEREALADIADLTLMHLMRAEEFLPYCDRADAIILWHHLQFSAPIIERLTRARILVRNGVGYDNVDIEAAAARGLPVSNVPDYGTEEVADHAITLTLALVRQLKPLFADVAAGNWEWRTASTVRRIRGQVFGIVGCGRIGTAAAVRAKALGFDVCFYDPYVATGYEKAIGVRRADTLEELLAESDVVSLHVPLSRETRRMIDEPQLKLMKRTAYLVNTSRGGVVHHQAIYDALAGGCIAGAGLDVLENEPEGAAELYALPNCLVTPHSAFYSQESMVEMRRKSAGIVRDALTRGVFRNVVNG